MKPQIPEIDITENITIDKPSLERTHPIGNGIHKIWRFKNGYGASVVRFKVGGVFGSHTNDNEWELGVLKFDKTGFRLTYDTKIADDVIGYLSDKKVERLLKKIKELK